MACATSAPTSCARPGMRARATFSAEVSALAEGVHVAKVVAIDQAGNRRGRTWMVGVDRRPPTVELSGALAERAGSGSTSRRRRECAPASLPIRLRGPASTATIFLAGGPPKYYDYGGLGHVGE